MSNVIIKILLILPLFCIILFAYDYTHDNQFRAYIWAFGGFLCYIINWVIIFLTKRK